VATSINTVIHEIRELPAGIGQDVRDEGFGIGVESSNRDIIEDDYGISVKPEKFSDIFVVSGVDSANMAENARKKRGGGTGPSSSSSSSARVVSEDEDAEEMNEDEMEAFDLSEGRGIIRGRNGRPPSKVSTVARKIAVLAEISYVPGLEGRVSARDALLSVRALQPSKLIVLGGVGGDDAESDEVIQFAEKAKETTGSKYVLTPSDGEVAEISVGHAAFSARLVDVPFEDREADPVEYAETKLGDCSVSIINNVATGEMSAVDGSLVLAPTVSRKKCNTIHLSDGEVLLTDLRTELIATAGMKAEYKAGTGYSQLLVNNRILVRKEGSRFLVEGPLCEDFFTVRSILSGQFLAL
jgi:Cleavage and polyadenylation factor 2 C-terminal